MNTVNNTDKQFTPVAHAIALATAQSKGCEQRCRRWRHHAAVRRNVILVLLAVLTVLLVGNISTAVANRPLATGALSTSEAVNCTRQMLKSL